jgi:hypothetical protein
VLVNGAFTASRLAERAFHLYPRAQTSTHPTVLREFKSCLRKMRACTVKELWKIVASFLKQVFKDECEARFANSGHA